jgi:sporulation protein YlmC with PRC-barrel domain
MLDHMVVLAEIIGNKGKLIGFVQNAEIDIGHAMIRSQIMT